MRKIRGVWAPSETAEAGSVAAPPEDAAPPLAPVVLLGGTEDTRLLLRGLLRLHRRSVLLETQSPEDLDRLPPSPEPKVLILDAGSDGDAVWPTLLTAALGRRADLRALVILPRPDPSLETRAREAGAREVLVRPFTIHDFIESVASVARTAGPG